MATPLYARHTAGLAATYAEIENLSLNRPEILAGTPGSITVRQNGSGATFFARQYYDFDGRKRDDYIGGQPGTREGDALLADWRKRIAEATDLVRIVRLLAREGYATLTPKQFAALRPLAGHGLFAAGALLVGTHAFGAIVNRLGIRASSFATEDVDIARASKLALKSRPQGGLAGLLLESGIEFVEVPPLDPRKPSTKFKERGRSKFSLDVLAPAKGDEVSAVYVPELETHATALPYLRYLVSESQEGVVMSSHGAAAVRLPLPERFALHKLIVSRLRKGRPEKSLKDLRQAAILIAALGELHPGALVEAFGKTALSTRKHIRVSLDSIRAALEAHPQSWEEIRRAVKG